MNKTTGMSLYLQTPRAKNVEILNKGIAAGVDYVFTSLNIPEKSDNNIEADLRYLIEICYKSKVKLFVDISSKVLEDFNLKSLADLSKIGLNTVRLDYGFSKKEIISCAQNMEVVINASTLKKAYIEDLIAQGLNTSNIIACHNFYPKPYTGLSISKVKKLNKMYNGYGIRTISFICGDEKRAPLFEGLPTIEDHRNMLFLESLLSSHYDLNSDIIMVGDVDLSQENWRNLKNYNQGYVEIKSKLNLDYHYLYDEKFHDRLDSSDYVVRLVESRSERLKNLNINPGNTSERKIGDICISNKKYQRYCGEVEICKQDMVKDCRVNVIGKVDKEHKGIIKYISDGQGLILKEKTQD